MAEDDIARVFPGHVFELRGHLRADSAEPFHVPAVRGLHERVAAANRPRALGDDDDAELGAECVALADGIGDAFEIERNLRNQDRVCPAGDAGVQGDPSGVASHHFDDDDALVGFGSRVQPVDRIGCELHGGVESEAARRPDDVVVDGLGNADDRNPLQVELVRDAERSVAADDDERVEAHLVEGVDDAVRIVDLPVRRIDRILEWVAVIGRAENRAAQPQDAGDVCGVSTRVRDGSSRPSKLSSSPTTLMPACRRT